MSETPIHGHVESGYEPVRDAFARNFTHRGEVGAAVAVWRHGRFVVDLWGGWRDPSRQRPWERDTLVPVFSATKGVAALCLALAHSRGWLDYDAPVAVRWPEFAHHGKAAVTVRDLLAHRAGLCAIDEPISAATIADRAVLAAILANQRPAWTPGTRHGYHAISYGFYANELLRRCDPQGRSIGRFLQDELAGPLGIAFHVGTPADLAEERIATIVRPSRLRTLAQLHKARPRFVLAMLNPRSLTYRTLRNPYFRTPAEVVSPRYRGLEIPSSNGIGEVRGLAKLFGVFASGGAELGVRSETLAALAAPATVPVLGSFDVVLKTNSSYGLGMMKPGAGDGFGSGERCYGASGIGGSFAYADPELGLGYAYAGNAGGYEFWNAVRERSLREALDRCTG